MHLQACRERRLIRPSQNPAQKVAKPRRLHGSRHALTREQVIEIGQVAATTGNDTELDSLIIRIHIEAACRRAGVLELEVPDLDPQDCLIRLREKGGTVRWQPISPLLMRKLVEHVSARGGEEATTRVLRYRDGRPITARRYDYLSGRIRSHLPWAARLQVSAHWMSHTTLTYVEREFGEAADLTGSRLAISPGLICRLPPLGSVLDPRDRKLKPHTRTKGFSVR